MSATTAAALVGRDEGDSARGRLRPAVPSPHAPPMALPSASSLPLLYGLSRRPGYARQAALRATAEFDAAAVLDRFFRSVVVAKRASSSSSSSSDAERRREARRTNAGSGGRQKIAVASSSSLLSLSSKTGAGKAGGVAHGGGGGGGGGDDDNNDNDNDNDDEDCYDDRDRDHGRGRSGSIVDRGEKRAGEDDVAEADANANAVALEKADSSEGKPKNKAKCGDAPEWKGGYRSTKRRRLGTPERKPAAPNSASPQPSSSKGRNRRLRRLGAALPQEQPDAVAAAAAAATTTAITTTTTSTTTTAMTSAMAMRTRQCRRKKYHWLLRSLLSPSLRVRRTAMRILLDGTAEAAAPVPALVLVADGSGTGGPSSSFFGSEAKKKETPTTPKKKKKKAHDKGKSGGDGSRDTHDDDNNGGANAAANSDDNGDGKCDDDGGGYHHHRRRLLRRSVTSAMASERLRDALLSLTDGERLLLPSAVVVVDDDGHEYDYDYDSFFGRLVPEGNCRGGSGGEAWGGDADGGDPAVQVLALLTHLVCDGPPPPSPVVVVIDDDNDDDDKNDAGRFGSTSEDRNRAKIQTGKKCGDGGKRKKVGSGGGSDKSHDDDRVEEATPTEAERTSAGIAKAKKQEKSDAVRTAGAAVASETHAKMKCASMGDGDDDDDDDDDDDEDDDQAIESFVAAGGLRWLCSNVLMLSLELMRRSSYRDAGRRRGYGYDGSGGWSSREDDGRYDDDNDNIDRSKRRIGGGGRSDELGGDVRGGGGGMPGGEDRRLLEAIQGRIALLVDLCYRVVMFASLPYCPAPPVASARTRTTPKKSLLASTFSNDLRSGKTNDDNEKAKAKKSSARRAGIAGGGGSGGSGGEGNCDDNDEDDVEEERGPSNEASVTVSSSLLPPSSPPSHRASPAAMGTGLGARGRTGLVSPSGGGCGSFLDVSASESAAAAAARELDARDIRHRLSRESRRRAALHRVRDLLWSSNLPSAYVAVADAFDRGGGFGGGLRGSGLEVQNPQKHSLSPLSCLLVAYEVLRSVCGGGGGSPAGGSSSTLSSGGPSGWGTSVAGGGGGGGRQPSSHAAGSAAGGGGGACGVAGGVCVVRGMDRCLAALGRLVDPDGAVVVTSLPPPPPPPPLPPPAVSAAAGEGTGVTASSSRRRGTSGSPRPEATAAAPAVVPGRCGRLPGRVRSRSESCRRRALSGGRKRRRLDIRTRSAAAVASLTSTAGDDQRGTSTDGTRSAPSAVSSTSTAAAASVGNATSGHGETASADLTSTVDSSATRSALSSFLFGVAAAADSTSSASRAAGLEAAREALDGEGRADDAARRAADEVIRGDDDDDDDDDDDEEEEEEGEEEMDNTALDDEEDDDDDNDGNNGDEDDSRGEEDEEEDEADGEQDNDDDDDEEEEDSDKEDVENDDHMVGASHDDMEDEEIQSDEGDDDDDGEGGGGSDDEEVDDDDDDEDDDDDDEDDDDGEDEDEDEDEEGDDNDHRNQSGIGHRHDHGDHAHREVGDGQFDDAIIVVGDDDHGSHLTDADLHHPHAHHHHHQHDDDRPGSAGLPRRRHSPPTSAHTVSVAVRPGGTIRSGMQPLVPAGSRLTSTERKKFFLRAGMAALAGQHPHLNAQHHQNSLNAIGGGLLTRAKPVGETESRGEGPSRTPHFADTVAPVRRARWFALPPTVSSGVPLLTLDAERGLLRSLCDVVRPPKRPLNLKIFLRRAPTQEEFFRGSLSRNPIGLSSLRASGGSGSGGGGGGGGGGVGVSSSEDNNEPRVRDLRQHIANDLQMSDSAELLELLVANKILDINLKLRVVSQVLWKDHVLENATAAPSGLTIGGGSGGGSGGGLLGSALGGHHRSGASGGATQHMISAGSGLAMVFSTGPSPSSGRGGGRGGGVGGSPGGGGGGGLDANTPVTSLPPMVVTYRLAGVDGEATEDKVEEGDLVDPEAPPSSTGVLGEGELAKAYKERMEKEYGLTRVVVEGRGASVLLRSMEAHLREVLRQIRRDDVLLVAACASGALLKGGNPSRTKFNKSPAHPALILLRHCAQLAENRRRMVKGRAPTVLLRMLMDVLNAVDESSALKRKRTSGGICFQSSTNSGSLNDGNAESSETQRAPHSSQQSSSVGNNPTADALQGLIEVLASDMSADVAADETNSARDSGTSFKGEFKPNEEMSEVEEEDDATLPLLLTSLRTTSLSQPLRCVIAKLLPFLTYGRRAQSAALASHFMRHIVVDRLSDGDHDASSVATAEKATSFASSASVLMETFVQAAIALPPGAAVCEGLRSELGDRGFVQSVGLFVLRDVPDRPPPWSPALFGKVYGDDAYASDDEHRRLKKLYEEKWSAYFLRDGMRTALKILIGLCAGHSPTQSILAQVVSSNDDPPIEKRGDTKERRNTSLLQALHWIESTSDNASLSVSLNGLGILAETLLDGLQEGNNAVVVKIRTLRKATRDRKREIAEERRSRALVGMSSFGPLAGGAVAELSPPGATATSADMALGAPSNRASSQSGEVVTSSSSIGSTLASMMGLAGFACATSAVSRQWDSAALSSSGTTAVGASAASRPTVDSTSDKAREDTADNDASSKPAWLLEMEAMEDETGLTCAVCQEGRTLQPSELLGLYAYVKKVSIPFNRCGGRGNIDGTVLLLSLPRSLPSSLRGTDVDEEWYRPARTAADALQTTPQAASAMAAASTAGPSGVGSSSAGARPSHYVTTVTAGNAIHCSCHSRARTADRNHPKAPKSEWEGAALRNSRVTCNVILPLVSTKSTKVPLMAVESALADHQAVVSNLLGTRPKSMLWNVLHDIRFLLLRMAYGEALNADCGGGSLTSNCQLLFHMLFLADVFANDAEHDAPETAQHARAMDGGFLVADEILRAQDFTVGSLSGGSDSGGNSSVQRLQRAMADATPMACLACILFHNVNDDTPAGRRSRSSRTTASVGASSTKSDTLKPHPKRRWALHKDRFLRGLVRCAGRRKACGVEDSGCAAPSRGSGSSSSVAARRIRSASFSDWDELEEIGIRDDLTSSAGMSASAEGRSAGLRNKPAPSMLGKRSAPGIIEHALALRPMMILYAIFDALSAEYAPGMEDDAVDESAVRLVAKIEACQKAKDIQDLMKESGVDGMDHDTILENFLKGKEEWCVV